jgi:hypothetical protein
MVATANGARWHAGHRSHNPRGEGERAGHDRINPSCGGSSGSRENTPRGDAGGWTALPVWAMGARWESAHHISDYSSLAWVPRPAFHLVTFLTLRPSYFFLETRSLPTFARSYPRRFTFYVAHPIRSILASSFLIPQCSLLPSPRPLAPTLVASEL